MQLQKSQIYEFDNFRIDVANRQLLRDGENVALPAKAFDMLVALIASGERLIGKDELFNRVWPDQIVEESNLTVQVSAIRKALGDRTSNPKYLMTVPGHGYRFIGVLRESTQDDELVIERHSIARIESHSPDITGGAFADHQEVRNVLPSIHKGRKVSSRRVALFAVVTILAGLLIIYFVFKRQESLPNAPVRSIAVLPFKPLASDSRNESLELGMADTLITQLGSIKDLSVRPTSAVRKYSDLEQDPLLAGKELNVDAVVDGSIQKIDDRIRVNVRVLRVADGSTLWSKPFDDRFVDIFAIQESISNKVVASLALKLGGDENLQLQRRHTENPAAYEAYLRGRYHCSKQTPKDFLKGIENFEEAIKLDSNYALAYAGLADTHNMMGYWGSIPPREAFPKAKDAARKALQLDDKLGEAYAALAYAEFEYDWKVTSAENNYKRALELNPGNASTHQWYAEYLMIGARFEESLVELKRAREIDPLSQPLNMMTAALSYEQRRYDEAITLLDKVVELDQSFAVAYDLLAISYARKGMYAQTIANYEREFALLGESPQTLAALREAYKSLGINGYWRAHVELLKARSKRTYVSPIFIAMDYAELGDHEKVLEWLNKAYADRSGWLLELDVDPTWDKIRGDPRFKSLIKQVKASNLPTI